MLTLMRMYVVEQSPTGAAALAPINAPQSPATALTKGKPRFTRSLCAKKMGIFNRKLPPRWLPEKNRGDHILCGTTVPTGRMA